MVAKNNLIDIYIDSFPIEIQKKLHELRAIISEILPNTTEVISYKMPAFKNNKVLVYFAGYKNHIGFYPTGIGIEQFKNELTGFKWSKGAIQFEINKDLPVDLIHRICLFKMDLDIQKNKKK